MKWSFVYKTVLSDVIKNSIALYMAELLQKTLKQPEPNTDLFSFCEDTFLQLDKSGSDVAANFPIYFSLQLAPFLGIHLRDNYSVSQNIFNLYEGKFSDTIPVSSHQVTTDDSYYLSQLLKAIHPHDLSEIKMNRNIRFTILKILEEYYAWHVPEFGNLKTLAVLSTILA